MAQEMAASLGPFFLFRPITVLLLIAVVIVAACVVVVRPPLCPCPLALSSRLIAPRLHPAGSHSRRQMGVLWWWWWWFVVRRSSLSSAPHGSSSSSSLSSLRPSGPCLLLVVGRSPSHFPSLSTASTCDPPHKQWLAGLGQVLGRSLLCLLSSISYNPSTPRAGAHSGGFSWSCPELSS